MYLLVDLYNGANQVITDLEAKEHKKGARKVRISKKGVPAWITEETYLIQLSEPKEEPLLDACVDQIKSDIGVGDMGAIYELLDSVPKSCLEGFLSET